MANCIQCGAPLSEGSRFCTSCGSTISTAESAGFGYSTPAVPQKQNSPTSVSRRPRDEAPGSGSKYELISTGGIIGILLLMAIPVIGQLLMLIWALGGCRKIQKRNLARAALIMTLIALILGAVMGFAAKKLAQSAMENAGITQDELLASVQSGLSGDNTAPSGESGISGLLGLIGALSGGNTPDAGGELGQLADLFDQLEALGGESSGMGQLIDQVEQINEEAAKHSDGWPSELPAFPSGAMRSTASYRTEFVGTTLEDTQAYINTLKAMGFVYQDFYGLGMSEADMSGYGGWWGYNGKWYISISYADGTAIIDHMTELPDLSSLLG